MCTVTFIPAKENIYLTSNRDEHFTRSPAIFPEKYANDASEIIYPKDKDAGGSWVAMKSSGDAAALLNGAFTKHVRTASYRKSRGLVFVEIIRSSHPDIYFDQMELDGIEPFTMVTFFNRRLYEFRWDGNEKYTLQLDPSIAHIWSSVTLYNETARNKRRNWFKDWQRSAKNIDTQSILNFHRSAGSDDAENGLIIDRDGKICTVSITSIKLSQSNASMTYVDLESEKKFNETLPLDSKRRWSVSKNAIFNTRKLFIKIFNREYWPHNLVYAPLYLYWFWLSIKARSFFFFNTSNPLIKNGGFLMGSKKEIYDLMPDELYAKTIFCEADLNISDLKFLMKENNFNFPLITKPDIGWQGLKVELLHNEDDLIIHAAKNKVDFLLQEFVNYKNEVGIFYYRFPGEQKGNISGIVGKEFITVVGDGRSTIEELLWRKNRYFLQLPALKTTYGKSLHSVLPVDVHEVLAPYGNHSRGAKFTDLSFVINDKLLDTIDTICKRVPEFYYGRLDIKYNSWEELCDSKNFSVIELNGAGSEPTHIYDPKHSLFFVWKEIIRHWRLLFTISKMNAEQKKIKFMSTSEGLQMFRDNSEYLKLISQ
jgi:hypothetical protein